MKLSQQALLTVGFNLVPLMGVFLWHWSSFDLIFLYWLENLVIGVFALFKMSLRSYDHKLDRMFVLFLVPFFLLHYGFFCYGHGTFIVSLFGDFVATTNPFQLALDVLSGREMQIALAALIGVQIVAWVQDIMRNGFGTGAVFRHTVDPYRRIIILHLTLFAGGFLMTLMGDPAFGLVGLVLIKTYFDWVQLKSAHLGQGVEEVPEALLDKIMASQSEPAYWQNDPYARRRIAEETAAMLSMVRKLSPNANKKLDNLFANRNI